MTRSKAPKSRPNGISSRLRRGKGTRSKWTAPNGQVVQLPLVLDLLLVDPQNPRSVAFQLASLDTRFASLALAPREQVRALLERVRQSSPADLAHCEAVDGGPARRRDLDTLLGELSAAFPTLAQALDHAYLSHAIPQRRPATLGSPAS